MKVKMISNAAGPEGQYQAGTVVEVSPKMGKAFLDVGAAIAVGGESLEVAEEMEVADVDLDGAENADRFKGKKKK